VPLVRIDLRGGKPADYHRAIADAVHQCMVSELRAPADDRFQVITEHDSDSLIYDPAYLNLQRSDEVIFIQITLNQGRTLEMKQRFTARWRRRWPLGPGFARRTYSSTS